MWLALLALLVPLGAQPGSPGDVDNAAAVARGRELYRIGASPRGHAFVARVEGSEIPAANLPCAQCHGLDGRGGSEGGVRVPDLRPARLTAPYGTRDPRRAESWRPPYDRSLLRRAIRAGLDPAGRELDRAMPRYEIAEDDLADLLAYLAVLDEEQPRGVGHEGVHVGLLVPLSGPQAELGRAVRALLERHARLIDERGGIHGRRLALHVADCGADAEHALAAARALGAAEGGLVAFLAPSGPAARPDVLAELALTGIPVIGPLGEPAESQPNGPIFHLLPSRAERGRVAARLLSESLGPGQTFACLAEEDEAARELERALLDEAARLALPPAGAPDACSALVLLGDGPWLERCLAQQAGRTPRVIADAGLLGTPARLARDVTWLAPPMTVAAFGGAERFEALLDALVPPPAPSLLGPLRMAHAAAELLAHGLVAVGRELDSARLVGALQGVTHLETGVLPPLAFGRGRRVGTRASLVLSVTAAGELAGLRVLAPLPAGSAPR
jgi:mono/diheme cytochrome c family protein